MTAAKEKAMELKDKAFDLAKQITDFMNENCTESTVAFLGLSLVIANMIHQTSNPARSLEFVNGATAAALKDLAKESLRVQTIQ